jgi:hypothetical protein
MDQFVGIIARQVQDWGTIIGALDLFEVFVVNEFNRKTGPTYLPENILALSFEDRGINARLLLSTRIQCIKSFLCNWDLLWNREPSAEIPTADKLPTIAFKYELLHYSPHYD